MRQAIETRYHGPTNYRGTRVSARASAGRIFLAWDHSTGIEENHARAARALAEKYGWRGEWVGGCTHDERYVWTTDGDSTFRT